MCELYFVFVIFSPFFFSLLLLVKKFHCHIYNIKPTQKAMIHSFLRKKKYSNPSANVISYNMISHNVMFPINDVTHILRSLTPPSPLSPILLNRLYWVTSPIGRSPLPPRWVISFMDGSWVQTLGITERESVKTKLNEY